MWIKWIHIYNVKEKQIWETNPTHASWMVRKILKAKETVDEAGITHEELMNINYFSIKKLLPTTQRGLPKGGLEEVNL